MLCYYINTPSNKAIKHLFIGFVLKFVEQIMLFNTTADEQLSDRQSEAENEGPTDDHAMLNLGINDVETLNRNSGTYIYKSGHV